MNMHVPPVRFLLRAIAALVLCAGPAATAHATPHSTIPSVCAFQLDFGHRYFDGIELTTVVFESPRLTLSTDTLGAWARSAQPFESAGFTLRHRNIPGLSLCISVLPTAEDAASEDYWDGYVQGIQGQLGTNCAVSEVADSADGRAVVRVLGGRTREAFFTTPTQGNFAEYHVHVTKGASIVVFVLRGPADVVADARDDFRFFLSRLERVAK